MEGGGRQSSVASGIISSSCMALGCLSISARALYVVKYKRYIVHDNTQYLLQILFLAPSL